MFDVCRSESGRTVFRTFDDYDAAVAWVDESESGSIAEWATGVILYSRFPRAQWV